LFEDGLLGRRTKETIATWISGLNRCPYCADSHGYYLHQEGASRGTVDALIAEEIDLARLTAKERSLLEYLALVNSASYRTTREQVETLIV
jgi:AhpD family alkylhydroperoxidase